MAISRGQSAFALYREQREFPTNGQVTTRRYYKGRKAECQAKADELAAYGWSVTQDHVGPVWELVATFGGYAATGVDNPVDNPVESPEEIWTYQTVPDRVDAFANALISAEASLFAVNTNTNVRKYRAIIEAAVEKHNPELMTAGGVIIQNYPQAWYLYDALSRGATTCEVETYVLKRTRNYSNAYEQRVDLNSGQYLFTGEELVNVYGIPAVVANKLPVSPIPLAEVPNTLFVGWRQKDYSGERSSSGRISEVITFEFALWELAFYRPAFS